MQHINKIGIKLRYYAEGAAIEAGHYYQKVGQTLMGAAGWICAQGIIQPGNKRILFIDDVHEQNQFGSGSEDKIIPEWEPTPSPDEVIYESQTQELARELIHLASSHNLTTNHKGKKMFKVNPWFPIAVEDSPTCVAMDAALSVMKWDGLDYFVNVLPLAYKNEQTQLSQFIAKISPLIGLKDKHFDSYYFT